MPAKTRGARSARYGRYRREVTRLTDEHSPPRPGLTRQHHVPISRGFAWDIPAELIGSRDNVAYWPLQRNVAQGTTLDETGRALLVRWGYDHLLR
jgi:hypothetical protein